MNTLNHFSLNFDKKFSETIKNTTFIGEKSPLQKIYGKRKSHK